MTTTNASPSTPFFTPVRVEWDREVDGQLVPLEDLPPTVVQVPSQITTDRVADYLSDNYGFAAKQISTVLPTDG